MKCLARNRCPNAIGLICCLALSVFGCQSVSPNSESELTQQERDQNQIEIMVDAFALPQASALSLQNMCEKLIKYGDTAVPELAKNIENRIDRVRQLSIYCLGMIYRQTRSSLVADLKPRLISRLKTDYVYTVRLEAATALCLLGDYQGVYLLINALRSDRGYIRMTAYQALVNLFNRGFNYDYNDAPRKREQAIRDLEQWWLKNQIKYLSKVARG